MPGTCLPGVRPAGPLIKPSLGLRASLTSRLPRLSSQPRYTDGDVMDPRQLFFDDRFKDACAYCGNNADTRDHVPSKVLLDEPLPPDLPVVAACASCNTGFSHHERVVACLVDCLKCASTEATDLRPRVRRLLSEDPRLVMRMERAVRDARLLCEVDSVSVVVSKLSKGHVAFLEDPRLDAPSSVRVALRPDMSKENLRDFDSLPPSELMPEIGTRAFINAVAAMSKPERGEPPALTRAGWSEVQTGRYRYAVILDGAQPIARFVLSEFLFCEVIW